MWRRDCEGGWGSSGGFGSGRGGERSNGFFGGIA